MGWVLHCLLTFADKHAHTQYIYVQKITIAPIDKNHPQLSAEWDCYTAVKTIRYYKYILYLDNDL